MAEEVDTDAARMDEVRRMVEAWETEGGAQGPDEGTGVSDAARVPAEPVTGPDERVTPDTTAQHHRA